MKYSLGISNFLEEISIFPILLFSFISLHWSLRKAFLPLLANLWNSAFRWVYLSFSPLLLASLLFSAICKASSDNHFAFLHFFFLGMVLITASCTMSWTSVLSAFVTKGSSNYFLKFLKNDLAFLPCWFLPSLNFRKFVVSALWFVSVCFLCGVLFYPQAKYKLWKARIITLLFCPLTSAKVPEK